MRPSSINPQEAPLQVVGGNRYGRYPKISDEQTFNMITSDDWLVPMPGFQVAATITQSSSFTGRAIYTSERWGNIIAVIGNGVYGLRAAPGGTGRLSSFFIGRINTYHGDVFIDENIAGQIAICDGQEIYIYNWANPTNPAIAPVSLPVRPGSDVPIIPGYITYQDGYFITVDEESANFFLSNVNDGTDWNWNAATSGPVYTSIQTKPVNAVAALRAPSRGNLLYVFGSTVTEMWYDVGAQLFPYQRSTSVSIDYGCLSPATIAAMDSFVCWLGINERSGPVIMISEGADITPISNDGIDFKLDTLIAPDESYAFFYKQDGHLFYQITFTNPQDNMTLVYDFNTRQFFSATDEDMNYHPAERVAFYNNTYYFVSINDGNVYQMDTKLTNYDYTLPNSSLIEQYEIPRVRVCPPVRLPDSSRFVVNDLTFTIDQGADSYFPTNVLSLISTEKGYVLCTEGGRLLQTEKVVFDYQPIIELSISKDGANAFGSFVSYPLNALALRKNRVVFWKLGAANDLTVQLRFRSKDRVIATNGIISIYQ